jgi:hypothetical protein
MRAIPSADDYFARLRNDPEFAREMSERQRQLGMIYSGNAEQATQGFEPSGKQTRIPGKITRRFGANLSQVSQHVNAVV